MSLIFVTGAAGTRLAVRTAGRADGVPIVFVHGWAMSGTAWAEQFADPTLTGRYRLLAPDLRGHGESAVPPDPGGYADPATWAADLAAVLAVADRPAVLVGSSYGGLVITDYLRERGAAAVAGIVLVGALTEIGGDHPGGMVGPVMRDELRAVLADDPAVAVPALTRLFSAFTSEVTAGGTVQRWIGDALRVPPKVRRGLFRREQGGAELLAAVPVPALVAHGTGDVVVDPSTAEYAAGKIPGACLRWFSDVGHVPFVERADQFGRMLDEFAERAVAGKDGR